MSKHNDKEARLDLCGDMTLRTIADAHRLVSAAVSENDALVLDVAGVTDCDLSFVQLIEAARKTCDLAGKALSLCGPASGVLLDVLRRGGFLGEHAAFWLCAEPA